MRKNLSVSTHFRLTNRQVEPYEENIRKLEDRYAANIRLNMPDGQLHLYCVVLHRNISPRQRALLRTEINRLSPQVLIDPGDQGHTWVCALTREQSEHLRSHPGVKLVGGVTLNLKQFKAIFFPQGVPNPS